MPNRLADAISPYLRSHADNPVDWQPWGPEPFAEARRRGVPVMVSIGYSTCHWCHVMARESFSDRVVAERLNRSFVAIKVDREEHPDVDSSYLAAASAFTGNLGWPLTVFVTPDGRAFYAGTYFPPAPVQGVPAFTQVLDAVEDAWLNRRDEVEQNAAQIAEALAAQADRGAGSAVTREQIDGVVRDLARFEDSDFGGFGGAPKFPVAAVQLLLLDVGAGPGEVAAEARGLVKRTLLSMARSPLRDSVEGGFFRYSTRRDWHDPHYERMLYDNAQLLRAYSRLSALPGVDEPTAAEAAATAAGIADFLLTTLRTETGGFGSAQDSESDLGEGGYYALDAAARAGATPPKVDEKVLTGWNGLAIGALAEAGVRHARSHWVVAAEVATRRILSHHVTPDGRLLRAATERGVSAAVATLEDYGMLAEGLIRLALATGDVSYAVQARRLVDGCLLPADDPRVFAAPGGGDPVLAAQGLALASDPSEGAYPSGLGAAATAALLLAQLGAGGASGGGPAGAGYRAAAERAVASVADLARDNPLAFGASLTLALDLSAPATQLVVVTAEAGEAGGAGRGDLARIAQRWFCPGGVSTAVSETQAAAWSAAGFELFESRVAGPSSAAAYLCHDFVCRLPATRPEALAAQLG
ncbi:hypothetical protein AX769_08020 [Frondihabitans sp. PAMC 28766]|uniref:thioredoxin domain-containing protein n=1 Tax=Frondihabitans sp. PAMC 28766 TaxID=1795630 RepID=UPI00078EBA1D|nr:DUF255 domain-containing protein [Frondihabitans sp. PAMC 28766]AMM20123.1 hypothetical protein AX769_08020 [Frondihabitans sp. PAMC 28766]